MTTIVHPPITEEKILAAKVKELQRENERLIREASALKYKLENVTESFYFLSRAIEEARINWTVNGANSSLSNLVLSAKNYRARSRGQTVIK